MSAPVSQHLIGPDLRTQAPVFVRGEGVELIDGDGRHYLDAASGVGVTCIGYSASEVVDAMREQAGTLPYLHAMRFEAPPAQQLADLVASVLPGDLDQVFFASGGSEANESVIKFVRQYWVERGQPERWKVIGRRPSFHGNTLATLSVGWHAGRRQRHAPLLLPMPHIGTPNSYRGCEYCSPADDRRDPADEHRDPADEHRDLADEHRDLADEHRDLANKDGAAAAAQRCTLACAAELEDAIQQAGPETVAAFIAEPVVAAAGGVLVPPPGYFQAIREICDRHDVLFVADEVFTGFGRLGTWFGMERFGVLPDIMVFAKGITAGYAPLGGFAVRTALVEPFRQGSGRFEHNFTYAAHPVAAAVGIAVIGILQRDRLVERVAAAEPMFAGLLRAQLGELPVVGDVRSIGLLGGVELVADTGTKQPFPASAGIAARATRLALDEGVIVYPCSGGVDGEAGDYLILAPPFVSSDADLEQMVERTGRALRRLSDELA
jgi:adenosylmethionine-8-amino-7-oxononanoate aminotransferase